MKMFVSINAMRFVRLIKKKKLAICLFMINLDEYEYQLEDTIDCVILIISCKKNNNKLFNFWLKVEWIRNESR